MNENHTDKDEEAKRSIAESSVLFHPYVFIILVIGLFLAIWFKLFPLISVLAFLIILTGFIYIWKKLSLRHLQVSVEIPVTRLFAGDPCEVHLFIHNKKWLPLVWLELGFEPTPLIKWGNIRKNPYIVRFLWVLSFQQINKTIHGEALHRGVYSFESITMTSGDGF